MTRPASHNDIRGSGARQGVLRHFPPFLISLGVEPEYAIEITKRLSELFEESEDKMLRDVGQLFTNAGVRDRWGHALANARAVHLANSLLPLLEGKRILDLLCGDGAVGVNFESTSGREVLLVERPGQRGVVPRPWLGRVRDFDSFSRSREPSVCDTSVLSTVLHHEEEPMSLLELAAFSSTRRIVIIENCIEEQYDAEYHLLVDAIFNRSLYQTDLLWPGQHRTAEDWIAMCSNFGSAKIAGHLTAVPGIPLPHTLIVVDL